MIIRDTRGHWVANLFAFQGTALRRIWRRLLLTTGLATALTYVDLEVEGGQFHEDLTTTPFTLMGLALGIFLGFRNNTSYDRFWEGRKLWGAMVNVSRSFTRQLLTLIGSEGEADEDELADFHREMVHRTAAYVHAFRMHLRDDFDFEFLATLLPADEIDALKTETNKPIAILQTLGDRIREAWLRGWIHPQHVPVLEASLTEMTAVQGACERIKSTPIPFSYTALIHRLVAVYCFALPFGIVNTTKWFTPVVVLMIAYAFFGLDAVGDEIEDPFGTDANDLPLTAISTMIEHNVRQRIGDEDLPPLRKPIDGVLQ
ncbi:MAG: bestrophin family protein [Sandaracinaceae bacterium]